jgi:hypothetical protein
MPPDPTAPTAPDYQSAFKDFGAAASDLFAGVADTSKAAAAEAQAGMARTASQADLLKSAGDLLEGNAYGTAATEADLNAQYTAQSTAIQQAQADRSLFLNIGQAKADIGGSGGTEGGSAGDILRASASQGALNRAVLGQQGLITEAGFQEQAASYRTMQQAAGIASQEDILASQGEEQAAKMYEGEAAADRTAAAGQGISAIIQGVAGVAAIGLAPFTGGASAAIPAIVGAAEGVGGIGSA